MDTGEPLAPLVDKVMSANAYLGARPVVEALAQGAQIVLCGRVTDTALALAPMIHEFGWGAEDWDLLAAGTIAGHIIECGAQCTGGNFSRWWEVPDLWNVGYPIVEAREDGTFAVTKHEGTGGMVTVDTVAEQLLYEMGDPTGYITPDVTADFTSIRLRQDGQGPGGGLRDQGRPNTPFLKVSASYLAGYKASGQITARRPAGGREGAARRRDRLEAAGAGRRHLRARGPRDRAAGHRRLPAGRLRRRRRICPRWCSGSACGDSDPAKVERFGKEIAPLVTAGPPGRDRLRRRPAEAAGDRSLLAGAAGPRGGREPASRSLEEA